MSTHHLTIHGASNLDTTILNVRRNRRALPVAQLGRVILHILGLFARIQGGRTRHTGLQQALATVFKLGAQGSHKAEAVGSQDLLGRVRGSAKDLNVDGFGTKLHGDKS